MQGVSFRTWMLRQAEGGGVDGWVRNRADGGLEAILAGGPEQVRALIDACRTGPPLAIVTDVIEVPATEDPGGGFRITS